MKKCLIYKFRFGTHVVLYSLKIEIIQNILMSNIKKNTRDKNADNTFIVCKRINR